MRRGARGMWTIVVIGVLGMLAMMMMYTYTAEKLLPPSSAAAQGTVDLLTGTFPVAATGRIEAGTFELTYIPDDTGLSDSERRAEMEKMARFVETNYPEPLAAVHVTCENHVSSGCGSEVRLSELRYVPPKKPPVKK